MKYNTYPDLLVEIVMDRIRIKNLYKQMSGIHIIPFLIHHMIDQ